MAGRSFGSTLRRGDVVALIGELGSGKTQFAKGVCTALGVTESVTSPTFVLLNRYTGKDRAGKELLVYHFDLYRIDAAREILDLGFEEIVSSGGVCMIEWAEKLGSHLPASAMVVKFNHGTNERHRLIESQIPFAEISSKERALA